MLFFYQHGFSTRPADSNIGASSSYSFNNLPTMGGF